MHSRPENYEILYETLYETLYEILYEILYEMRYLMQQDASKNRRTDWSKRRVSLTETDSR